MNTNKFSLMVFLVLIISANLFPQNWPQFRGLSRDGKVAGFKAPSAWPAGLTQLWKVSVGTGDASPVLAGNNIYIKDAENLIMYEIK